MNGLALALPSARRCTAPLAAVASLVLAAGVVAVLPERADAHALAGDLDMSFHFSGQVELGFAGTNSGATSGFFQPDGKLVLAGNVGGDPTGDFGVARLVPDEFGYDEGFAGGIAQTDVGNSGDEVAWGVAATPDGKIVAAGRTAGDIGMVEYTDAGVPADSFGGGDGKVTTDLGGADSANAVAVQPDGKIVVFGYVEQSTTGLDLAVLRYTAAGVPDADFGGGDGLVTLDVSGDDVAVSGVLQPDGKPIAVGATGDGRFLAARFTDAGEPDPDFSGDGWFADDLGADGAANAVALQPDGKLVLAGEASQAFALERLTAAGVPDQDFINGPADLDPAVENGALGVALQPDGKILAAGFSGGDSAIARFEPGGDFDASFGDGGATVTDTLGTGTGAGVSNFAAGVLFHEGKIWTFGYSAGFGSATAELARYLAVEDPFSDLDLDGVIDDADNCVDIYNPDQLDHDHDDIGDACDDTPYPPFSPSPPSGPPPTGTQPPLPKILGSGGGSVMVSRRGAFALPGVRVECAGAGPICQVTVIVTAKLARSAAGSRIVRLAAGRFTIGAGRSGKVKVMLTRKALRLLRRLHRIRANARLTVVRGASTAASTVSSRARFTLKAPRPARR